MLRPLSVDLIFASFFVESKTGRTGLTVTVDVWRITTSGATEIVTGGSATEVGDGVYRYTLSSSLTGTEGFYTAVFKTSTTSVDQQHLAGGYMVTNLLGNVNVTQISGDSVAADNAEAFFDGTGYAGTNNTIPTVTTVTNGVTLVNDAITSAKIDASAVTEIQSGLSTLTAQQVWEYATRTLSAFSFNVTVGTNNDKAGYSLSSAGIQAIWDALTSALVTAGSVGRLIVDNLNATITSRASQTSVDDIPTTSEFEARTLTAASYATAAGVSAVEADTQDIQSRLPTVLVGGRMVSDAVAISGSTAAADAVEANIGNLDAGVSTRASQTSVDDIPNNAEFLARTLPTADYFDPATDTVIVGTNNDKTGYTLTVSPPTASAIADAVWDEALAGHLTAGSTGAALDDAGAAGDPWSTALPGAYGAGTAGNIVGNRLDAAVSTRSTLTAQQVWEYSTRTLTAISATLRNQIADNVLRRSWASAAASADGDTKSFRSPLGAIAKLVNRVSASGSTLTVYEADDTTVLGTQAVTTNPAAEPIVEVNTN